MTNECAITLFELYAHSCCFYLLKCSLHWRNPYQSMHCVGGGGEGGGGGGEGALPSPYPPPILTLPHLPSIPSLPPLPHPKKVCSFFFVFFSAQIQNSEKGYQEYSLYNSAQNEKELIISCKFCTEQKLVTNEYAITLFAPVSVQKSVIAR